MKKIVIILIIFTGYARSQELMNFYLEPNAINNSVTLHTSVFKSMATFYRTITTETNGNEIDIAICYNNSALATRTFDHQEFPISLPEGFSSFIFNVNLFGDDDGLPCENNNLVDFGSISFEYPYTPTETTAIPDDNFEFYFENTFSGDGISNNNLVFTHRIKNIGKLMLNGHLITVNPIESIIGIEDIPRLKYLYCEQNPISSINVMANLNLIELTCGLNLVGTLDITNNLFLKKLWVGFNFSTDLNVTNNLLLENLSFSGDGLTQIDLSQNSNLKYLSFNSNDLTEINLSGNPNLITLGIWGTSLIVILDLSNNLHLEELRLTNTSIVSLSLVNNTELMNIEFESNDLAYLDITGLTNLKDVFCIDNQLTSLDLSTNPQLEEISLLYNNLSSLNLKNGNNESISYMLTIGNPNLYCIDVDDKNEAPYPGWGVDSQTVFSEDCTLGTEDNFKTKITLFPNPAQNIVHISNTSNSPIISIQVFDLLGKLLHSEKRNTNQLNVSQLDSGIFFIKIKTDQGILTRKLLKN